MLTTIGAELIAEERARQIEAKGYTAEHDKQHTQGELAAAAICYAAQAILMGQGDDNGKVPGLWPFEQRAWKAEDSQLENLIKAGAFLAAEIDRLQADLFDRAGVVR